MTNLTIRDRRHRAILRTTLPDALRRFDEKNEQAVTGSFLYNLAMGNSYTYGTLGMTGTNALPLTMQVFLAQQKVILEYAKNPCVLVGRCADFILRERSDVFKVFIYSDMEKRIARAVERYGCDRKRAIDLIAKSDKGRARHYATFTDWDWGSRSNYDLMINSGSVGVERAADIICTCAGKLEL